MQARNYTDSSSHWSAIFTCGSVPCRQEHEIYHSKAEICEQVGVNLGPKGWAHLKWGLSVWFADTSCGSQEEALSPSIWCGPEYLTNYFHHVFDVVWKTSPSLLLLWHQHQWYQQGAGCGFELGSLRTLRLVLATASHWLRVCTESRERDLHPPGGVGNARFYLRSTLLQQRPKMLMKPLITTPFPWHTTLW